MTTDTIERSELIERDAIERFIKAGNALFTLQSKRTTQHFTYKVIKGGKPHDPVWFVQTRFGPERFGYIGLMDKSLNLHHTTKSKAAEDAPCYLAIKWFLRQLKTHGDLFWIQFFHEGRCCRCGRTLTNPESIKAGIGPECAGKESW